MPHYITSTQNSKEPKMIYGEITSGINTGNYNAKKLPPKRKGVEYVVYDTTAMPCVGDSVSLYLDVAKGIRKPLHLLIKECLKKIPLGKKLNKEKTELVDMTDAEKWEAGALYLKPTQWLDDDSDDIREKTQKELLDAKLISISEYNEYMQLQRKSAYSQESDPLGMQVLRGEIKKEVWLKKIEEIKKRFPKMKI